VHRAKGKLDVADSKYLLMDPLNGADPTAPPKGEMKGIVKRVRVSGPNLLITIESGDFLELKVHILYTYNMRIICTYYFVVLILYCTF
jgi:hypothetical protein